jgi:tRNA pseudouridine55 synthase
VLVIALGNATRSIDRLMATDKRYSATIDLSAFTTTDDLEGDRTEVVVGVAQRPDRAAIEAAIRPFTGEFPQRPPAFSAVKVGGRRAYERARRGEEPAIAPRNVTVHALELVRYVWPHVELDIRCGKGFYVRSLARDLGEALHCGGHCTAIRRTAVGPFTLDMSSTLERLPMSLEQDDLMPLDQALQLLTSPLQPPSPS